MRQRGLAPVDFRLVQDVLSVLPLIGLALLFWLLLVRPQARRRRELLQLQSSLTVGDEVMLASGIYGTIRGLDDNVAQVEIANGVVIRVVRGAIGQKVAAPDTTEGLNGPEEN